MPCCVRTVPCPSQRYGTTTDELLRAAIVGYEASYTLAVSIQPGHKALGYHATGTCGVINMVFETVAMMSIFASRTYNLRDIVLTGNLTTLPQAEESFRKLRDHIHGLFPEAGESDIRRIIQ